MEKILGVEPEADKEAIRNAYRALARVHHFNADGPSPAEFKRLQSVYEETLAQTSASSVEPLG